MSPGFSPTIAPLLGLLSPEGGELVSCFSQGWLWVLDSVLSGSPMLTVGSGNRQSAVIHPVCPSGGVGGNDDAVGLQRPTVRAGRFLLCPRQCPGLSLPPTLFVLSPKGPVFHLSVNLHCKCLFFSRTFP